jgi:ribosome-interacting GTPase 1
MKFLDTQISQFSKWELGVGVPANLPPEYFKAEERYLRARTLEERISATEELIRAAPKHKGTERFLRTLRQRLAKLRRELEERREKRIGKGRGPSFSVKKEGAAQVALVGLPNSGKSWLLRKLTNASPEVADYPFTTRQPVPGMMQFEDVQVQLVEVPAVVEGSSLGRGLGAQPLSAARNADAIALVIDASSDPAKQVRILVEELGAAGIRLNRRPPRLTVQRRSSGGIEITGAEMVEGGVAEIKRILQERRIHNALVVVEEPVGGEEIEEALDESVVYRRAFIMLNKLDVPGAEDRLEELEREFGSLFKMIPANVAEADLKKLIYGCLDLIRVYTKRPDEEPAKRPLVLPRGSTVLQVARAVHKDFERDLKFARVWGSTRFPGQQVSRDYVLQDGDVVELHA